MDSFASDAPLVAVTATLTALVALVVLAGLVAWIVRGRKRAASDAGRRLARELARRAGELNRLAQHLQHAREDERARLARDLHDEMGSLLTSAKLDAARIRSRLAGSSPEALERLAHLVGTLDGVIAIKRRITADLLPPGLVHFGLVAALESLGRDFTESSGVELRSTLLPVTLDARARLAVYRLVQESLTNAAKHAAATHVSVSLAEDGDWVEVVVSDDGIGFDPAAPTASAHGLLGMRCRVEAERGNLRVTSSPGLGTRVCARLPRQPEPASEVPAARPLHPA